MNITDKFSRKLRDLRISVTDKCNFRCNYCMPSEIFDNNYKFISKSEILSFEEIIRLVNIFAELGTKKIRLTGGEPLLRNNLHLLIKRLSEINGITDISLTTNGILLSENNALELKKSGLNRITVSLDSLDNQRFKNISGTKYSPTDVLNGIDNAKKAGFKNIKVNMVVKKNVNDLDIIPMLKNFKNSGCIVRFIEFMDVGNVNYWNHNEVVCLDNILKIISKEFDFIPIEKNYSSEVAKRWSYEGGEFGIISSISSPFCGNCSRLRLTAEGKLYTCLFSDSSYDIKKIIRSSYSDSSLKDFIKNIWSNRDDRYSEKRFDVDKIKSTRKAEMSYIGG